MLEIPNPWVKKHRLAHDGQLVQEGLHLSFGWSGMVVLVVIHCLNTPLVSLMSKPICLFESWETAMAPSVSSVHIFSICLAICKIIKHPKAGISLLIYPPSKPQKKHMAQYSKTEVSARTWRLGTSQDNLLLFCVHWRHPLFSHSPWGIRQWCAALQEQIKHVLKEGAELAV